ncbi:uncharacterized protein PODANS_1_22610 [Podospora anserina S mat+]|uniref:Podospora anserina S mat+ genomic DNA chromosome 1, supercontig 6 n=2 Tax=Podospora TaxID=5144 RepID=B2AS77_PODAN|nr:uncharacterized protein PODANS_1_22610 [Podospora anserina S mat+]CAP67250.1 unnamed protein product [Podospora anserina S mat+]CDP24661.1 Putative protein of unknown function [Podospora anserina S mat+]VBB73903.1 Putative protein of unknown function [Podospora comata]
MRFRREERRRGGRVSCWICTTVVIARAITGAHGQSTVSVYIPGYGEAHWAALRGSIIGSDQSATTYTVFCAEKAPSCQIAGDLPFVFTEGPGTLKYGGVAPGTLTAELECNLDGTTAATCTGSSSFGANHWEGTITGPTQTVWTETFTTPEVTWGALTLTTPGPLPNTIDIDGTPAASLTNSPVKGAGFSLDPVRASWLSGVSSGAVILFVLTFM